MKRKRSKARAKPTGPIHGRIAERRKALNLTLQQLADRIVECGGEKVDFSAVWHWENDQRPDIPRLPALAKALEVSIADLVAGEDWPAVTALLGAAA